MIPRRDDFASYNRTILPCSADVMPWMSYTEPSDNHALWPGMSR